MQADALCTALDAVHAAILAGNISDLAQLTQTITDGVDHIAGARPQDMHRIRQKAARNTQCLQAAMKGIRAAQRRLAELRQASAGHVTYDQNGQRASLGAANGTLRQRI